MKLVEETQLGNLTLKTEWISFGTLFLDNLDLPKCFELDAKLNQPDKATMFGGGTQGYIDYPFLNN